VKLTYWNNSPDTLREAFFHLYANAAQPDSYLARLRGRDNPPVGTQRGTEVASMAVDGREAAMEVDNTILRVTLPRPLPPGASTVFAYSFPTHWGGMGRMKLFSHWGVKHFDGTQ